MQDKIKTIDIINHLINKQPKADQKKLLDLLNKLDSVHTKDTYKLLKDNNDIQADVFYYMRIFEAGHYSINSTFKFNK